MDQLKVDELSYGAAMALWGFRVSLVANARCTCVARCFDAAFSDQGREARSELLALVEGLVEQGRRQIWVAVPASLEITCDEVCILNALSAAQHDNVTGLAAHLRWLLAREEAPAHLTQHFVDVAAILYSHGYDAAPPARPHHGAPVARSAASRRALEAGGIVVLDSAAAE